MAEIAARNAQITAAPALLPRQQTVGLPTSLIGYWSNGNSWEAINCVGSGETWSTLASFAGCNAIHTGCTVGASQVANQLLTCASPNICVSLTIHSSTPVESLPDPNAKTQFFCQNTWEARATHLYRQTTTPTPSSSSRPSSSRPSTIASATSNASAASSGADSSPSSSQIGTPQNTKSSNNTGAIAGGTVAGIALALVIGFLIWYFGFHRRKQAAANGNYQQNPPMDYSNQHYSNNPYYANPPVEVDSGPVKYAHVGELPGHPAQPPGHVAQLP